MFEIIVIVVVAFVASGLTLFSGFGLGTILTPAFALFFPVELAIVLTAVVHFLNNLFKLALLGKNADKKIVIRFGIPSIIAAFIGAYVLTFINDLPPFFQYSVFDKTFVVMPVKLIIAIVLAVFALIDIIPSLANMQFDMKYMSLGGILSGFFGGLSGNQGALRSAFLMRAKLSKESFIATGVIIACVIDTTRLFVYSTQIASAHSQINYTLVLSATLAAFAGAFIGNKLLKKVTIKLLQYIVAFALLLFSLFLGFGIV